MNDNQNEQTSGEKKSGHRYKYKAYGFYKSVSINKNDSFYCVEKTGLSYETIIKCKSENPNFEKTECSFRKNRMQFSEKPNAVFGKTELQFSENPNLSNNNLSINKLSKEEVERAPLSEPKKSTYRPRVFGFLYRSLCRIRIILKHWGVKQ